MSVAFEQVSFSYDGERDALEDIELVVDDGEFLGVIGHTGSGKSTLVQLMNALLVPTAGRVLVDGMDTRERKLRRKVRTTVGLAFQYPETQLFANTVAEDVAFGPRNLDLPDDEVDRRVREALERVGHGLCGSRPTQSLRPFRRPTAQGCPCRHSRNGATGARARRASRRHGPGDGVRDPRLPARAQRPGPHHRARVAFNG